MTVVENLIDRLRNAAHETFDTRSELMYEAADEIDRLTAILTEIVNYPLVRRTIEDDAIKMRDVARIAAMDRDITLIDYTR